MNPTNATGNWRYYNETYSFKFLVITDSSGANPIIYLDDTKITYTKGTLIDISSVYYIRIGQSKNTSSTGGTVSLSWNGWLLSDDTISSY